MRGSDRPGCVVRQFGRHLQADVAGLAETVGVDRLKQVAGRLDVGDDQRLVTGFGVQSSAAQAFQIAPVVGTAGDGLLEDGRIRGHAVDAVLVDQALQPPLAEQGTRQIVEPDVLAERL